MEQCLLISECNTDTEEQEFHRTDELRDAAASRTSELFCVFLTVMKESSIGLEALSVAHLQSGLWND